MQRISRLSVLLACLFAGGSVALCGSSVVLTVMGAVAANSGRVELSLADLEAVGPVELNTHTPWTEGEQRFTGVLASKLLQEVGSRGEMIDAIALDDRKVTIPRKELEKYPIIIAFKHNGQYMRIRDKGPLWIIYPLDEYPELRTLQREHRMVWHLQALMIK
jgi:hypothetical protein